MKACVKCQQVMSLASFHRQPSGPMGRHSWCKECFNSYARETRNKKVTPAQRQRNNLWTRYRLRPEDLAEMIEKQGGECALCGGDLKRPVVDHNHETGAVRGVLCHPCNIMLPAVEDSEWTQAALEYLERYQ